MAGRVGFVGLSAGRKERTTRRLFDLQRELHQQRKEAEPALKVTIPPRQSTEAFIGVLMLNKMTALGMTQKYIA